MAQQMLTAECRVAAMLLEAGVKVNDVDIHGETALIKAVKRGHEQMLRLLQENGANYSVRTSAGYNAIQLAEVLGLEEIREILISHITRVAAEFEKKIGGVLKTAARLMDPLFLHLCYPVCERARNVSHLNYEAKLVVRAYKAQLLYPDLQC